MTSKLKKIKEKVLEKWDNEIEEIDCIHAGWRGIISDIIDETIKLTTKEISKDFIKLAGRLEKIILTAELIYPGRLYTEERKKEIEKCWKRIKKEWEIEDEVSSIFGKDG